MQAMLGVPVQSILYKDRPRDVNPSKYLAAIAHIAVAVEVGLGPLSLICPAVGVPLATLFHLCKELFLLLLLLLYFILLFYFKKLGGARSPSPRTRISKCTTASRRPWRRLFFFGKVPFKTCSAEAYRPPHVGRLDPNLPPACRSCKV